MATPPFYPSEQKSIVVKITDLCPYSEGGWCGGSTGQPNAYVFNKSESQLSLTNLSIQRWGTPQFRPGLSLRCNPRRLLSIRPGTLRLHGTPAFNVILFQQLTFALSRILVSGGSTMSLYPACKTGPVHMTKPHWAAWQTLVRVPAVPTTQTYV